MHEHKHKHNWTTGFLRFIYCDLPDQSHVQGLTNTVSQDDDYTYGYGYSYGYGYVAIRFDCIISTRLKISS
jgi:hypothetical protein